ncbi:Os01g0115100 [Oryza sativa Japonica Group]|uniref:Os01g0115100 protein n=1 Tax=Oryza sativa subsp. japonica TaxID=39947 RepID=C7IXH8_ORYSJ|nr:Os01g0115100 [Oryza sativa Japonica Group]|eukprot:NP_001172140.1 Os01g0115100 [Oryza sativa Japonica Group]
MQDRDTSDCWRVQTHLITASFLCTHENEAKQLYITMCACLRDCKDGTTGEELTEHITWCKVCKNIFKMNGTLPHWGCNGIKDSDDQWLNSDS